MVSGLLPALQFFEFYLIKSIKMGNRFKDLGKLSFFPIVAFGRIQYSWIGGFFFPITSQQDPEPFKDREAAVLIRCPHSWQEAWPMTHQSVENKDTHGQMSVDLQSPKNVLGRHRTLSGDNSVSEIVCFVAPECQPKGNLQHHHQLPHPLAKVPHIDISVSMCTFVHMHAFVCTCM